MIKQKNSFNLLVEKYICRNHNKDDWNYLFDQIYLCVDFANKIEILTKYKTKMSKSQIFYDLWHSYHLISARLIYSIHTLFIKTSKVSEDKANEIKNRYKNIFDCSLYTGHPNIDTYQRTLNFEFSYVEILECCVDFLSLFCKTKNEPIICINDINNHFHINNSNLKY